MNPIHWITRYLPWLLVLSLFILLAGCGDDDEGSTHTPQPALGSSDINKIYAHHRAAFSGCTTCHEGTLNKESESIGGSFIDLSSAEKFVSTLVNKHKQSDGFTALITADCSSSVDPYVRPGRPDRSVLLATVVSKYNDKYDTNFCSTSYGAHKETHSSTWDNEAGLIADLESWIEKGL